MVKPRAALLDIMAISKKKKKKKWTWSGLVHPWEQFQNKPWDHRCHTAQTVLSPRDELSLVQKVQPL